MYNLQNQDNEEKYQKLAQAAGFRPRFKMLKVQERSGAVVMTQPVKKCERQRGTQLHQLEHTDSQEAAWPAPDHSRTKAAEWQGAQGKGRRLCSGSTPGMWAAVVGTCSWGQLRGVSPRPEAGCEGCTWHHSEHHWRQQWQRGHTTALCCGQQLAMATTLQISLHYNLLGVHARIMSYLVSRRRSVIVFFKFFVEVKE